MRSRQLLVLGMVLAMGAASAIWAQDRGRGQQRGGRISRTALLRIEAVQKELELLDDQIEAIRKLEEELRGQRPGEAEAGRGRGGQGGGEAGGQRGQGGRGAGGQRGQGGRGAGGQRGQGGRGAGGQRGQGGREAAAQPGVSGAELQRGEFFVALLQQGQRGQRDTQELSDEERQKQMEERRQQAAERTKIELEKLGDILLPHQLDRLNEIYIQVLGVRALQESEVAKELGITNQQNAQIQKLQTESSDEIRAQMQAVTPSDDRDQLREKMLKLRKAADEKVLAVLSPVQKKKFEEMKGEPFQLPEDAIRGGGGQRGGGRQGGGGGQRGGGRQGGGGGQRGGGRGGQGGGQGAGGQARPERPI